jgi:2-dehydropantoate 2-reductase
MKKVTIVGAGGIGGSVAYALAGTGIDVTCVEVDSARIDEGNRRGLRLDDRPAVAARFVPFGEWKPKPDVPTLLCVKCYDNADVLNRLGEATMLLPIQNGIDDRLESLGHPAGAIASYVARAEPGQAAVWLTRRGHLHVGARGGALPGWVREIARLIRSAGLFPVVEVDQIGPYQHSKLMYNAAIAPLAAAAGLDNAALLELPLARKLFFAFLLENYAILHGAGKPLGKVGPFHPDTVAGILRRPWVARAFARAFVPSLRGTFCSMAGDIEKGRTEVANYNGVLARWAGELPCPLNRRAVDIVDRMARMGVRPEPSVLAQFES